MTSNPYYIHVFVSFWPHPLPTQKQSLLQKKWRTKQQELRTITHRQHHILHLQHVHCSPNNTTTTKLSVRSSLAYQRQKRRKCAHNRGLSGNEKSYVSRMIFQSSGAVWKSMWLSLTVRIVSVDVKQHWRGKTYTKQSSGAVWKSRWPSWAPRP